MKTQREVVSLVNISTEKWPPRHRTYFGSLQVRSPEPGEPFAITPIRVCTAVMALGDKRTTDIRLIARERFHGACLLGPDERFSRDQESTVDTMPACMTVSTKRNQQSSYPWE